MFRGEEHGEMKNGKKIIIFLLRIINVDNGWYFYGLQS